MSKYDSLIMNDEYNNYLENVQRVIDNYDLADKGIDITSAPLSPMLMDSLNMPILFMSKAVDEYKALVDKINSDTKKRTYFMLGRRGRLDNEEICSVYRILDCNDESLDGNTYFDASKFADILRMMQSNGYNFVSVLQTRPKDLNEDFERSIDNYLSEEMKEKELIRESGLNITVKDINDYENGIYDFFKSNSFITTNSTILMSNGELVMFGLYKGKLCRYTNLIDVTTALNLKVADKEEYCMNRKTA